VKAEELMGQYVWAQQRRESTREEAIMYYKENSLETKPLLNPHEEEIYEEVRKEIKEGKLKKKETVAFKGVPLDKSFFRAKDMDEETKRKAIAQGFTHVRGNELDGYVCGGGFYIKNNGVESSSHFIMKHLFGEVHENMQLEYAIAGRRVDAALLVQGFSLGIEIETGSNKSDQLIEKVAWLNEHFDQWIFVCPRKYLTRYDKLVDGRKSYCMTPKRAKECILELLTPIEHQYNMGEDG